MKVSTRTRYPDRVERENAAKRAKHAARRDALQLAGAVAPPRRRPPNVTAPGDQRMTIDEVAAEVETLAGTDWPPSLAYRLGYSDPNNLARVLERAGRPELARLFWCKKTPRAVA